MTNSIKPKAIIPVQQQKQDKAKNSTTTTATAKQLQRPPFPQGSIVFDSQDSKPNTLRGIRKK